MLIRRESGCAAVKLAVLSCLVGCMYAKEEEGKGRWGNSFIRSGLIKGDMLAVDIVGVVEGDSRSVLRHSTPKSMSLSLSSESYKWPLLITLLKRWRN